MKKNNTNVSLCWQKQEEPVKCLEMKYSQWPGQPGCSAALLTPGSFQSLELNQTPELCLAAFISPGTLGLTQKIPGIPAGFVCSIKRCPDKCCACSQTHPPFHQWSSFFLLITEYWRFPTLPYLLLDWRIILEGVKMTPLSAVWISLISWRVVCDGTSWD